MAKAVEELREVINEFEKKVEQIRKASEKEIRRARAILKRIERQEKPLK